MRIGVVGCGVMGRNHARVVRALGHDLVGIVDPVEDAAREVAELHGSMAYSDVDALVGSEEAPQALVVASPTATHVEVATTALEAGVHVLVEKPIAPTVADGHRIVDAAAEAGRVLAVGHIERHNPAVAYVKRHLDDGAYGRPITISTRRVSNLPGRIRDVGCVLDIGIHDIDVLNHLAGEAPASVYALGGTHATDSGFEDHANLLLQYPGGVKGVVEVNWLTPRKVRRLALTCDKAYVEADYIDQSVEISRSTIHADLAAPVYPVPVETHREDIGLRKEEPLRRELSDFVAAIEEGHAPLVDGSGGVLAVQVADAALRSVRDGAPVTL